MAGQDQRQHHDDDADAADAPEPVPTAAPQARDAEVDALLEEID